MRPATSGAWASMARHHLGHVHGRPAQVAHDGAVACVARGLDERLRRVRREVELGLAPEGDHVALAARRRAHRQGRAGGQALVAPRPVDDVGAQADARHAVLAPVHARGALVRLLVDAVMRDRMAVRVLGDDVAVGRVVGRRRARVRDAAEPAPLRRLEHVHRPDHVHVRAARRVGPGERDQHRGEVDDVRRPVLGQRALERVEVGHVAAHERDPLELARRRMTSSSLARSSPRS